MNLGTSPRYIYMGLDIETTGTSPQSELIQIGLYIDDDTKYVSDVGHRGNFHWEPKAFEVNSFTFERIWDGPPAFEVDSALETFLLELCKEYSVSTWQFIPVGFNVGSFDIAFVRKTFPLFFTLLGYRTIDLNALLLASYADEVSYKQRKEDIKATVIPEIQSSGKLHDALYDAELAIRFLAYWREF